MAKRIGRGNPRWQQQAPEDNALSKVIATSRSTGTLNLSNRALKEVPHAAYQLDSNDESIKWWEVNELTKLDLSHNELQHVPAELWSLTSLHTLHLCFNQLQQLPSGLSSLSALKLLDVSDNHQLTELPEEVASLPRLASISCNNCNLQQLPSALGVGQPQLSAVNASGNQLVALPAGLQAATALVVLNMSHNKLSKLPATVLSTWKSLKELDVSHNNLQVLPDAIGKLPRLSMLDIRNNQLAGLPAALGGASSLMEIKAGFNKIAELPDTLGMLDNLRVVDLRNNVIQELPSTVCGLQLVLLDLTNNSLRRLPPALGCMTTLRSMPLDGNPLKLMRRELWTGPISGVLQHLRDQLPQPDSGASGPGSGPVAAAAPSLQDNASAYGAGLGSALTGGDLVLRGKGLSSIPAEVWQVAPSLAKLDLSDNNLGGQLNPDKLEQLQQVKKLCLNSCNLSSWPLAGVAAGCLESLITLECRANPFHMPLLVGGLACCPALRSLDLSGVKGLQTDVGFFQDTPQLEVLVAAGTGMLGFPTSVLACKGLRQLQLNSNNISSLPVELTQLTRLAELDLTNNQLSNLPPQLGLMSGHLRVLLLEGNCLRTIRRPLLEKGTTAVLDWLKDKIPT